VWKQKHAICLHRYTVWKLDDHAKKIRIQFWRLVQYSFKDYKTFKKELKLFLLLQSFYSVEEFVSSQQFMCDMYLTCAYTEYK